MPRTENTFEQEGSRKTVERDYPRFLPSAGSGKRVMPMPGDDAMAYSGLHGLLDELAEAIHAFEDQLAEQEQILGSLIEDHSRTLATRPFRNLNPGGGSTRTQSVFMNPESMARPGDGSAMQSSAGVNERQDTYQPGGNTTAPASDET